MGTLEDAYRSVLDGAADAIYVTDMEYNLLYVNRKAQRIGEALTASTSTQGKKCYQYFQGLDAPCPHCKVDRLSGDQYLVRTRKEKGETIYELRGKLMDWAGTPAHIEYIQNVSESEHLFHNVLSNMSHEIRTPMNVIIGLAELAEEEAGCSETVRTYLEKIEQSGQYLLGILNDVLEMSRIDSGKVKLECDWYTPAQIAAPVLNMMIPMMEKKNIRFHFPKALQEQNSYECYVDAQKIRQLLMNLLNNAWKFTPSGGQVTIESSNISIDREHHLCTDMIMVSDNGCGMSQEFVKKRLFIPFEQERLEGMEDIPGTGLGLTISQNVVRQMGGDIAVESEPGKGTRFTITYPYLYRESAGPDPVQKKEQEKHSEDLKKKNIRCILAEDNEMNALIAAHVLEKNGMTVTFAKNGKEAVELFSNSPAGSYDLILMDIRMPGLNGWEAAEQIRRLRRPDAGRIPIVAMSANSYESDRRRSLEAGMNEHLAKPINGGILIQTIERVLQK